MDRLRRLEVFVRVAELASFSAVGRDLRLAQSQVSRAVLELEHELGCALFTRNTRSVVLTAGGVSYLEGVRRALHGLAAADEAVRASRDAIDGTLRITAPVAFGDTLAPVIAQLVALHRGLVIEAVLVDRTLDIVGEGFDVAVRSGVLKASSLRSRRLGSFDNVLVAAPFYVASHGAPRSVADLAQHEHVVFTSKLTADRLTLIDARNRSTTIRVPSRVRANELRVVHLSALAGAGIAALPLPMVRAGLESGALVRILRGHLLRPSPIHVLFPPRSPQPARVQVFVEALSRAIEQQRAQVASSRR